MKTSATDMLIPTFASLIMIGSLALFFIRPTNHLFSLSEASNGANYSFPTQSKIIHLSVFRDGSMAIGSQTLSSRQLQDRLSNVHLDTGMKWRALRISIHPDAPMKSVRSVYEASLKASFDVMYFAVNLPSKTA